MNTFYGYFEYFYFTAKFRDGNMTVPTQGVPEGTIITVKNDLGATLKIFSTPIILFSGDRYYPAKGQVIKSGGAKLAVESIPIDWSGKVHVYVDNPSIVTPYYNVNTTYDIFKGTDSLSISNLAVGATDEWRNGSSGQYGLGVQDTPHQFISGHMYYARATTKYTTTNQISTLTTLYIADMYQIAFQRNPVANTVYTISGIQSDMLVNGNLRVYNYPRDAIDGVVTYAKEGLVIDLTETITNNGDSLLDILANAGYTTVDQIKEWCDSLPWINPSTPLVLGRNQQLINNVERASNGWKAGEIGNLTLRSLWGSYYLYPRINNNKIFIKATAKYESGDSITRKYGITYDGSHNDYWISEALENEVNTKSWVVEESGEASSNGTLSSGWKTMMSFENLVEGLVIYSKDEFYIDLTSSGLHCFLLLLGMSTNDLMRDWIDAYIPFFTADESFQNVVDFSKYVFLDGAFSDTAITTERTVAPNYDVVYKSESGKSFKFSWENSVIMKTFTGFSEMTVTINMTSAIGQIGSSIANQNLNYRTLTLGGLIYKNTDDVKQTLLDTFVPNELGILTINGKYEIECFVLATPSIDVKRKWASFSLQLRCPYPLFSRKSKTTKALNGILGRFTFPWNITQTYSFGERYMATIFSVVNSGQVPTFYTLTIKADGQLSNPYIECISNGQVMKINKDFVINEVVTITITNDSIKAVSSVDGDVTGLIDFDSNLFEIPRGSQRIKIGADSGVNDMEAQITFQPKHIGVVI